MVDNKTRTLFKFFLNQQQSTLRSLNLQSSHLFPISFRGATHSQVVQLLRSSGPSPTLVVFSSLPMLPAAGPDPSQPLGTRPGAGSDDVAMKMNVKAFKDKVGCQVMSDTDHVMVM